MNSKSGTLALIPARAGSKGLPHKNVLPLLGKPLISWTIDSAIQSELVNMAVVSTDSEKIREISVGAGALVPFLRPVELASDHASSVDVALHAIDFFRQQRNIEFEYLVLLEPTSPIRNAGDIDMVIHKLQSGKSEIDAVVTIGNPDHHPHLLRKTAGNLLLPAFKSESNDARRQDLQEAYFPFGVAYAIKTDVLQKEKTFYPKRTGWQKINRDQQYEIDDQYDFMCVETIMKFREENK